MSGRNRERYWVELFNCMWFIKTQVWSFKNVEFSDNVLVVFCGTCSERGWNGGLTLYEVGLIQVSFRSRLVWIKLLPSQIHDGASASVLWLQRLWKGWFVLDSFKSCFADDSEAFAQADICEHNHHSLCSNSTTPICVSRSSQKSLVANMLKMYKKSCNTFIKCPN